MFIHVSITNMTMIIYYSIAVRLKPLKGSEKPKKTIIGIFCGIVGGTVCVTCFIFVVCKRSRSRAPKTSSIQCDDSRNNMLPNQTNDEPIDEDRLLFEHVDKPGNYKHI